MVSPENCAELEAVFPGTKFVKIMPGQPLPFSDAHFDIGFSSAVLEHVGTTGEQLFFVQELLRTCRSVFLTTPDRAFPIEMHTFMPFLHWLPKHVHRVALRYLGFSFWAADTHLNLLTRRELSGLASEALRVTGRSAQCWVLRHRLLGLSSNLILWISGRGT
jgi:hypothetical protein